MSRHFNAHCWILPKSVQTRSQALPPWPTPARVWLCASRNVQAEADGNGVLDAYREARIVGPAPSVVVDRQAQRTDEVVESRLVRLRPWNPTDVALTVARTEQTGSRADLTDRGRDGGEGLDGFDRQLDVAKLDDLEGDRGQLLVCCLGSLRAKKRGRQVALVDGHSPGITLGAGPFPRHWVYGDDRRLRAKSATINYRQWSTEAFGKHTPWGDTDSPVFVSEVESALERELSGTIMRANTKPTIRHLGAGERLTRQGEVSDDLYVLLDGVLTVDVDGRELAEIGPGAILGERSILEQGRRTASLTALTACTVASADRDSVDLDLLRTVAASHHREEDHPA